MSLNVPSRKQVIAVTAAMVILRAGAFVLLGTGWVGTMVAHFIETAANVFAIVCSLVAARRGRGISRIFWLLFGGAFTLQLVAECGWNYCLYFNITVPEAALFPSLFYRLYAVPMAIALFLSEDVRTSRLEAFLDSCIAVGLVGLCMYQVQMAELKAHDSHIWQLITTSAIVNVILVLAAVARFAFSAPGVLRGLFGRLAVYLAIYSCVSFSTSYVDAYLPGIDDAFDLAWIFTYLSAASLAIRWRPSPVENSPGKPLISRRAASLSFNLTMATMVLASAILGLRVVAPSRMLGLFAVGLVLFSYAIRCALMQDSQEKYVAALRESNTRYECVSLATNDVLWERNFSDDSLSWNDNVYSLFGYKPGEVRAGRDWWIEKLHPEDRQHVLSSIASLLKSDKRAWSGEYRIQKADGSYAFVLDRCYVVRDSQGKATRLIGSIQDLSLRKEAELQIQRAREAAEAAAQAKSNFLSNMSHEIRTPLNGVVGMLDLAAQTELSVEQKELLNLAGESAGTLLSVVNDVLDFSKIEAGRMELEKAEIDVADIVAEATRAIAVQAHKKELELVHFVAANVPDKITGDSTRLKQVLINLLANAVKFTQRGEIALRVEMEPSNPGEVCLRFSIADTGIGIPAEKQQTIFIAFSQADNSVTRRFGGTGLGLAICSKIVDLMGGKIWVESEVGKGSIFSFTARFGQVSAPRADDRLVLSTMLGGIRALIVSSYLSSRTFMQDTLRLWGAETIVAGSLEEGVELLTKAAPEGLAPHLIFCDGRLADGDGFALVDRAKSIVSPTPEFVMMLTSDDYQRSIARCRELRIAAHLLKPFKRTELRSAIQLVLPELTPQTVIMRPESAPQPGATRSLTILLAEDNLVNQKVAAKMLQKLGHSVRIAANGREAVEKAKAETVDLILMDGHMPEMDGLAATRVIREGEKTVGGHVPIVAMTAMAMPGDREACLQAGMDGFIAKPITMKALQEVIQQVMERETPVPIHDQKEPIQAGIRL